LNSTEYIKFVVGKVEKDFLNLGNSLEYIKVMTILQSLKSSENILRDIYILSGTKKLRQLSYYIIFILKKMESGRITIDNFIENLNTDKKFITTYLQTYYNLEPVANEPEIEEETKFIFDAHSDEEETIETVYSLAENSFKVEQSDNELITEEFKELTITDDDFTNDYSLELVHNNVGNNENEIPVEKEHNVFELPDSEDKTKEEIAQEELFINKGSTSKITSEEETTLGEFFETLDKNQSVIEPETNFSEEINSEDTKETISDSDFFNTPEEIENLKKQDEEVIEKLEQIEAETNTEIINSAFLDYQSEVFEKNKTITGLLDDLDLLINSNIPSQELKVELHHEICSLASSLRDYSQKMSFEIITKVYSIIANTLDEKFKDLISSSEYINTIKESIEGVEKLIRGEELKGFKSTISKLEDIEKDFTDLLYKRKQYEKKQFDFGEEERKIIDDFKDNSERNAYLALKEKIAELENNFNKINDTANKLLPAEYLRKLSVTFTNFREIANIARILEKNKIAQLAEAGYLFVKFIQNYRINPYQKETSEAIEYLIFSFKMIYFEKPVKDLDLFITFLNDPVQIFHHKNK